MPMPYEVKYASQQFLEWLGDLKDVALLQTHNQCYAMLRAVLHELRDHLTVTQNIAFADALPPLVRGIYYEGWSPLDPPRSTDVQEFIDAVFRRLAPHHVPPDGIVFDVFTVLVRRSELVNATVMRRQLPEALAPLWSCGDQICK